MAQEAFQLEHQPDEEPEPKETVIYAFPEKEQNYGKYKNLGGILSQEEYQHVLEHVAEGKGVPSTSLALEHANTMARFAGITLSPETIAIYEVLSAERQNLAKELPDEMSDQKLLAEALRIAEDKSSLATFIENHHI